jgi:hypothetical protein
MANTYKDIVITPNKGSATDDPKIVFSGANTSVNTDITLRVYPDSNGTLSFEGTSGQLFSITNDLTGSLFSVNDISGMPSVDVSATGDITLAQYSGNVGIGTSSPAYKLDVVGTVNISSQTLLVGGTNVIAAIIASNANSVTLSTNVNTLAAAYAANTVSLSTNVNTLAATFVAANANNVSLSTNVNTLAAAYAANTVSLSTNVNTLAATFVVSNANSVSLSTNVNTLAAAYAANTVSLSTNVNTLAAAYAANTVSLSTNVNTLAATFVAANANNVSLSANINTLAATFVAANATFVSSNANTVSLSTNVNILAANVNTIAGAITNLTLENLPGAFVKRSVTAATTANIALFGTQTIDGVAVVAGNRVLAKDQALANQNGIYVVSAGAWTRSTDADTIDKIASGLVAVDAGTTNGGRLYDNDIKITDTLNTTLIVWNQNIDDGNIGTYINIANNWSNTNAQSQGANIAVLAAAFVTNSLSLSTNVNTLAAAYAANTVSLSTNVNTLAATFVAANANNVSLSTNVNTLAAAYTANTVSLSTNVNTLAATFVSANANSISLSTNVNTLAATFVAANANSISLSTNVNILAACTSAKLSNTSGTSYNGNLIFPTGKVGIGNTTPNLELEVKGNLSVNNFVEYSQTIAVNYTITTGRNALTAGPVTINSGITVTVPSGSYWTIV